MPDYKAMYEKLLQATEAAIWILIHAQQECEELYMDEAKAEGKLILFKKEGHSSGEE